MLIQLLVCSTMLLAATSSQLPNPQQESAKEIIDRIDRLMRGDSSHGQVEMTVVTRRWKRTLVLDIWSEGTEKALIRILKPKKEEGTVTLKVESEIWNYLPKIDRTIRVPTSMMMGSWMGSHFTNDDLVKESQLVRDYQIGISFEGERDGLKVYELTLHPLPEAPVVWGKIVYQVDKEQLLPRWTRYYGEDGELKRIMTFHDIREMGGRLIPSRMKLVPANKQGEYTEMIYHQLEFDMAIPERTFSLSALRR